MTPKFRVWDSVEKKFVEHFFITDNGLICNMEKPTSDSKLLIPIEKSELILMQSTGLKDKNGVEIFEEDVVSRNSGMPSVVKFGKWIYEEDFGYKIKNIGFTLILVMMMNGFKLWTMKIFARIMKSLAISTKTQNF